MFSTVSTVLNRFIELLWRRQCTNRMIRSTGLLENMAMMSIVALRKMFLIATIMLPALMELTSSFASRLIAR
ncbi:hypothetical protein TR75_03010 [Hydrogenibacillus schlegelii]|uniref:Uncharacterized protein n=1 Tax=Hydrogenibacillus schlegelii TaxID=1484 RepID=A0A132NBV5_HYDSH|nr:hypothetical protein TR75_03010 [Hydrogenibacillus schlegelii]OAR05165.1 hypothetical protein SA87_08430 [Hydrogenibacillus schlegelii]